MVEVNEGLIVCPVILSADNVASVDLGVGDLTVIVLVIVDGSELVPSSKAITFSSIEIVAVHGEEPACIESSTTSKSDDDEENENPINLPPVELVEFLPVSETIEIQVESETVIAPFHEFVALEAESPEILTVSVNVAPVSTVESPLITYVGSPAAFTNCVRRGAVELSNHQTIKLLKRRK